MSEELIVGVGFVAAFVGLSYGLSRSKPRLAGPEKNPTWDGPQEVSLKEGEKWICRCGQSSKAPFCDGTHNAYNKEHGTQFSPFKANRETVGDDTIWVCMCGQSKLRNEQGFPACDGSHKKGPPK